MKRKETLKHKASLMVHGGQQEHGVHYWEKYAPVVNLFSVRLLLAQTIMHKWHTRQVDYLSDEFSTISLDPTSEVSLALKNNVRDYIVNATTAFNYSNDPKRGNDPSKNIGLQTQSAHSHHLSHICQVQHAQQSRIKIEL